MCLELHTGFDKCSLNLEMNDFNFNDSKKHSKHGQVGLIWNSEVSGLWDVGQG